MSKAAAHSITPICPVERLGREWAELGDSIEALSDAGRGLNTFHREKYERRSRVLIARQMAIQEQVSWMTPRSPAGALFQMMLAFTDITVTFSEAGEDMEQVSRLLFGTRAWMARSASGGEEAVGAARLMPATMDARNLSRNVA